MTGVLTRISEQTSPPQDSEMIHQIFGEFQHAAASGAVPVVLFCAGSSGRILCPFLIRNGIRPACFCDNDPSRVGHSIEDVPIISFEELKKYHRSSLIIIATAAYQNFIQRQLLDNDFDSSRILSLDTPSPVFDDQIKRESVLMLARNGDPRSLLGTLQPVEDKLLEAYNLLADQKSKDLFIGRLALIASGFEYRAYRDFLLAYSEPVLRFGYENRERMTAGGSHFYFNNDIIRLQENEVLVDGGAFTGDSADEFLKACRMHNVSYKSIWCFEPDRGNYEKLRSHTSKFGNINCVNRGLWSSETTLRFISSAKTESYCARIQEAGKIADMEIATASIDELLTAEEVTLIKMDIEGAEIEALKGASNTIKKNKPKLAISAYHNIADLYEIPLLIHGMCPEYKLYLRHLGNYFDDTVVFAVA